MTGAAAANEAIIREARALAAHLCGDDSNAPSIVMLVLVTAASLQLPSSVRFDPTLPARRWPPAHASGCLSHG
jgi:hypothetical protein